MRLLVDVRSYHAYGDDFLISLRRFSSYGARTPQILHTKTLFLPYDVCDDVPETLFEHIRADEREREREREVFGYRSFCAFWNQ